MKICLQAGAVKQIENYFSISTDGVEIRIWFLTDSVVRIRAGFDGDFVEESYSLVTTAWEDRMDMFMKHYRKRIQTAEAQFSGSSSYVLIPRISHFHPGSIFNTGFAFSRRCVTGNSVVTSPLIS